MAKVMPTTNCSTTTKRPCARPRDPEALPVSRPGRPRTPTPGVPGPSVPPLPRRRHLHPRTVPPPPVSSSGFAPRISSLPPPSAPPRPDPPSSRPPPLPADADAALLRPLRGRDEGERERILWALERCAGNQTKAARLLGDVRQPQRRNIAPQPLHGGLPVGVARVRVVEPEHLQPLARDFGLVVVNANWAPGDVRVPGQGRSMIVTATGAVATSEGSGIARAERRASKRAFFLSATVRPPRR